MKVLLGKVRACKQCEKHLPAGINPVLSVSTTAKILIVGQAPGRIVHETGIPFNDKSGDNLRNWLGIGRDTFYDNRLIAIMPMGFCYPGTGSSGDLPPRPECAPLWHAVMLQQMKQLQLTLLIGQYAQRYYLGENAAGSLTETVQLYRQYLPKYFVLPHPSPRNNIWQKKNPWFSSNVLPALQDRVHAILDGTA